MRIRPCIDIHNGKVKQIVGSTLSDEENKRPSENFISSRDASYYAALYRDKGLPGGHIILLNAASDTGNYAADLEQARAALAVWPGGMQIGGGVTAENASLFLEAGASHVIVTSYVFRDGRFDEARCERLMRAVGKEHLVLDLSCRKVRPSIKTVVGSDESQNDSSYRLSAKEAMLSVSEEKEADYIVVTDRWQKLTDLVICDETLDRLSQYCDEFLIHAADVEGKRGGIEQDLVRILGEWQKKQRAETVLTALDAGIPGKFNGKECFPVTYAGGVHAPEDLDLIRTLGGESIDVTVGSALDLFGGNLTLDELVKSVRRN